MTNTVSECKHYLGLEEKEYSVIKHKEAKPAVFRKAQRVKKSMLALTTDTQYQQRPLRHVSFTKTSPVPPIHPLTNLI